MKIILPLVCSLLLIGCNSSETAKSNSAVQNEIQSAQAATAPEMNSSSVESVVAEEAAPTASITEPDKSIPEAVSAPKAEKAAVAAPKVETTTVDGSAIYGQKCASCHGAKAEKVALGKSQIIAQLNERQIKDALHGYKNGTYGKDMKALMQGQAKGLNDAQIDALAKYISAL